jgi:hypothetical protein
MYKHRLKITRIKSGNQDTAEITPYPCLPRLQSVAYITVVAQAQAKRQEKLQIYSLHI